MAKVLVIDDSRLSRMMAVNAVVEAGFEVVEAVDGQNGLEMFAEHQPDCVVTDLLMPVMNGQEFLAKLRKESVEVPVFVLTSDIQESTKADCEALGISGFLNKPVSGSLLAKSLQDVLSKAQEPVT